MTLAQLKAQLAEVEAKISEILTTGQSVSLSGSFSVTNPSIEDLLALQKTLRKRIFRFQGYQSRVTPDFSNGGNINEKLT